MIHQTETRFAAETLCGLTTMDQLVRLAHQYVWSSFDVHKVSCPNCKPLGQRAEIERSTAA